MKTLSLLLMLVISSSLVIAIGSTTYDTQPSKSISPPESNCNELSNLEERIKCRLENSAPAPQTPEACRTLEEPTKQECVSFYSSVAECYSLSRTEKDLCFRKKSGLSETSIRTANSKAIRNYIVALLYDLQERIELAEEQNSISTEEASEAITMIVTTKEKVLQKASKDEVKQEIELIKQKWNSLQ